MALLALAVSFGACGEADMASGGVSNDVATGDTAVTDVATPDTTVFDTGPGDAAPADTTPVDTSDAREDEVAGALFGLKVDERYLVPGNIAEKREVAAAGDLVAWVEGEAGARAIVIWDLATPDVAPRSFAPATLTNPRALALSDAWVVYVDDRFGDPDVFAIDLVTGVERVVVRRQGAQEAPAILGSRVAWEDCSACASGDGVAGREPGRDVIERELPDGAEVVRGEAGVADRAPSYGLLADGRAALTWVSGRATLKLERVQAGVSASVDVSGSLRDDEEVARVALWDGLIAWRPSPLIVNPDSMIVNPDSMYPSDVFTTDPGDGATAALTVHAELSWRMSPALAPFSERLAWLQIAPGEPALGQVWMVTGGGTPALQAEAGGLSSFAMGRQAIVFSAPRADNDGLDDVHVLMVELP